MTKLLSGMNDKNPSLIARDGFFGFWKIIFVQFLKKYESRKFCALMSGSTARTNPQEKSNPDFSAGFFSVMLALNGRFRSSY
ncbi:hypothetical protein [Bacillus sp. UMB0893]|uniref:hypothetical protein n=1 Tax=Bacillus sp. UMB0893 TaxID=2066053 RepID=UPI000C7921B6|nr:hypothetical protein [Bacillus sp. UMB0893]PLR69442.1 hypothetical protein CYJ36_03085 [Bacillus sp. UMB0893]